jgi:hypothetical protein
MDKQIPSATSKIRYARKLHCRESRVTFLSGRHSPRSHAQSVAVVARFVGSGWACIEVRMHACMYVCMYYACICSCMRTSNQLPYLFLLLAAAEHALRCVCMYVCMHVFIMRVYVHVCARAIGYLLWSLCWQLYDLVSEFLWITYAFFARFVGSYTILYPRSCE